MEVMKFLIALNVMMINKYALNVKINILFYLAVINVLAVMMKYMENRLVKEIVMALDIVKLKQFYVINVRKDITM